MHLSRPSARVGLLALAAALVAMSVAVSSASAATFGGGTIKIDFKGLKGAKQTNKGHSAKNTFAFSENAGTATMTKQASGNLNIGSASNSITLTRGGKKLVLQSFVEKLKSGKGTLSAKINGKGKLVDFFSQASANRIVTDSGFTTLSMQSSKMTLTKAGAAALNKAFGLKGKAVYKVKQAAGTSSFSAKRTLTVTGGNTQTVYDQAFVQSLRNCDISLGAVAPATAIPKDPGSAPEGGASLPINAQNGGALTADTLIGQVNHQGGTVLDRPAPGQPGNTTGKAAYNSPLTNFVFGFGPPANSLTAFVVNSNNNLPIGTVSGTPVATLTDTGGSVSLQGGSLNLSDAAAGTLSQAAPPLGANCPIPAGSKIGAITMTAQVE